MGRLIRQALVFLFMATLPSLALADRKVVETCYIFTWLISSVTSSSSTTNKCDKITLWTSNWKMARREEKLNHFVAANQDRLMSEISQGHGAFLADYAVLLGCPQKIVPHFSQEAQRHYQEIFSDVKVPADILKNTRSSLKDDATLLEECKVQMI